MPPAPMFADRTGVPEFVLDVSVAVCWLLTSQGTMYTVGVLSRMNLTAVAVPALWPLAMAGAALDAERRGLKSEPEVRRFLAGFASFRVYVDAEPPAYAWDHILPAARAHRASVPDAAYVELARRLGLPLATVDSALQRAAAAAGVPIFVP